MNMQRYLIRELTLYEFGRSHNTMEASRNICYAKGEGAFDYWAVTRCFKVFCLGCKNLDDPARSCRSITVDSEAVLQAKERHLASSTQRVSGKLSILQSIVVNHLHDLDNCICCCRIVSHVIKILQKFWLTLILVIRLVALHMEETTSYQNLRFGALCQVRRLLIRQNNTSQGRASM